MAERQSSASLSHDWEGIKSMEEALTEHHLKYLLEDTFDAHIKWFFIGLYLGLTHSMLSAIKANTPSSEEQYTETLSRWINGGTATVKRLIKALEANTVQMNGIAMRLQQKYEKRAQQEAEISESHTEETDTMTCSSAEAVEIGEEREREQRVTAGRDDERSESGKRQVSVPSITSSLTDREREVFEKRKMLRKRFNDLVEKVRELARAKYTADSFCTWLCNLPPKYRDEHISFVEKTIPQFSKAKTVKEIFLYLGLYWSFLSPGLLEYILDELEDEETKQEFKDLNEEVTKFRKTTPLKVYWKVEDVDPSSKPIPNAELWKLVTHHKPEYLCGSSTLEDVEQFRKQFAAKFRIDKVALCISKISPGSVRVSWSVPPSVASLLFADIQNHPERLKQLGLISATLIHSISVSSQAVTSEIQARSNPTRIGTHHYKCDTCGKKWVRRNSRGVPDTCPRPKCSRKEPVYPNRFEKSLRRMFGEFSCECGTRWLSGNSWEGMGQECLKCKTMVLPHTLRPLLSSDDSAMGEHKQVHCQMCEKLGYKCSKTLHVDIDTESAVMASSNPPRKGTYHYKCNTCGKEWVSRSSRGGAHTCHKCGREPVYPHHFKKSLRRMFGEFSCECGNTWSSGNSWRGMGQQCLRCETMVLPHTLRPLLPSDGSRTGEHIQDICEMCQMLGRNCRENIDVDIEDDDESTVEDDDTESIGTTTSTVSHVSACKTGSDNERLQSGSDTEDELAEAIKHPGKEIDTSHRV